MKKICVECENFIHSNNCPDCGSPAINLKDIAEVPSKKTKMRKYKTGSITLVPGSKETGPTARYRGQYFVTENGRRVRKSVRGNSVKDVEAKMKARVELSKQVKLNPKETVADYLTQWVQLNQTKSGGAKIKTKASREWCNSKVIPIIGTIPLQELNASHLVFLYQTLRKTKKANGTGLLGETSISQVHRNLHSAFQDAIDDLKIPTNPAQNVPPKHKPIQHNKKRLFMAPEEFAVLAQVDDPYVPLCILAVKCGGRVGELLGLRWSDINLESGEVHIQRTLGSAAGYGIFFNKPKTDESDRVLDLPIEGDAVKVLRQQLENLVRLENPGIEDDAELLNKLSIKQFSEDLVFPNTKGKPMDPSQPWSALKRILKKIANGIAPDDHITKRRWNKLVAEFTFHDQRHTYASIAHSADVDVKDISHTMGHSNSWFTNDRYIKTTPKKARGAMDKVDKATPIKPKGF